MRTPCSVLCVIYWKHWKALEARTASDVQTLCLISSGYTSAICSSVFSVFVYINANVQAKKKKEQDLHTLMATWASKL